MTAWRPIARIEGSTDVRAQGKAGLLVVDVQPDRAPPEEWQEAFGSRAGAGRLGDDLHLDGTRVTTWSAPDRLEVAVARIDMRIELANGIYGRSVAPVLVAEARRAGESLDGSAWASGGTDAPR